jgi:hypothetical protein
MWQIPKEPFKYNEKRLCAGARNGRAVGTALVLLVLYGEAELTQAQTSLTATSAERQTMTTRDKFYCNGKALNPTARAHHEQLTEKLIATRQEIVETEKGYEFQFNPAVVSLAELADWVVNEGKCCPFFDFHIDLEREGSLLCLRLTGEPEIKPFIRAEFQVPAP